MIVLYVYKVVRQKTANKVFSNLIYYSMCRSRLECCYITEPNIIIIFLSKTYLT